MTMDMNRRIFLASAVGAGLAATATGAQETTPQNKPTGPASKRYQKGLSPWPLCMNTSTIRPASLEDKIKVTAEAGWDAIEPWVGDLANYEKAGGDLKALGAQIRDRGLFVPNVIGLWDCMPATPEAFEESLAATRNRMRMCAAIGSEHVAAIPAPDRADFDLPWATHCYRELMKIGREEFGIKVAFEFVGFFKGIHRLGQACGVALDTNDENACLVADTFHIFRGDSGFNGLKLIQGDLIANFHWNDVPGDVPREQQGDKDRLYPGDGILPLSQILKDLYAIGYRRTLSLEIFKREYWEQDPKTVSETGLRKMQECIAKAGV